jgi:hypothetical protein
MCQGRRRTRPPARPGAPRRRLKPAHSRWTLALRRLVTTAPVDPNVLVPHDSGTESGCSATGPPRVKVGLMREAVIGRARRHALALALLSVASIAAATAASAPGASLTPVFSDGFESGGMAGYRTVTHTRECSSRWSMQDHGHGAPQTQMERPPTHITGFQQATTRYGSKRGCTS